ncbi:hypothetical protein PRIPAC_70520, partial [Pristionchus pacificus]|uniref:G protein-coupled receptor n=1 Tax=Pristionchus pacificus TaxID=54126 RepID=A0A2A6CZY1_PRIPA
RSECFHFIIPYLFFSNYQAMMYVVIGADMLYSIFHPFRYLRVQTFPYLILIQIPCILFGIEHPLHAYFNMDPDDPIIFACNPPLGTSGPAMQMWNITNIIVSITVVLLYGIIAVKMLCHSRGTEENTAKAKFTRGVVKSATVLTIFFSASWFLSKINDRFAVLFPDIKPEVIQTMQTYSVIPAVASFAQTYYVHFMMSRDYREAFKKCGLFGLFATRSTTSIRKVTVTTTMSQAN